MRTLFGGFIFALLLGWTPFGSSNLQADSALDPSPSDSESTFATPDAVFYAAVEAVERFDFNAFATLLTPSSQRKVAARLAGIGKLYAVYRSLDAEGKMKEGFARLEEVLHRHGLTRDLMFRLELPGDPKALTKNEGLIDCVIKDKPTFIAEMMEWLKSVASSYTQLYGAKLVNVKISGSTASGTVVYPDGIKTQESVGFVKIAEGWFIELPLP